MFQLFALKSCIESSVLQQCAKTERALRVLCAWEFVQPSCFRKVGDKEAIDEAPMLQEKKRVVLPEHEFIIVNFASEVCLQCPNFPVRKNAKVTCVSKTRLLRTAVCK